MRILYTLLALTLSAQQTNVIRVTTRLVEVNVVVRDKNGPVAGLTKDDFTLLDKGKPQKIGAFSVATAGTASQAVDAQGKPVDPLPPNIFSNRPERKAAVAGSTTVVLLDGINTHIRDQVYAKKQFLAFLKQVRPTDRIAVYALGTSLHVLHDFTTDTARLTEAVARYSNDNLSQLDASTVSNRITEDFTLDAWLNESNGMIADHAIRNRAETTAAALEAIGHHIARLPGRKNIVWISGSFPLAIGHVAPDGPANWEEAEQDRAMAGSKPSSRSGGSGPAMNTALYAANIQDGSPARDRKSFDKEVLRATRALNEGNIAVYPVDARGLLGLPKEMTVEAGPVTRQRVNANQIPSSPSPVGHFARDAVASNTGGRVFEDNNDINTAIRTAIDDAAITYTLGFYPDAKTLDNKFHPLSVKVNRPGVEVRFRKGYLASPDDLAPEAAGYEIQSALSTVLEATGISLMAGIEPKPGSVSITVAIEPKDIALESKNGKYTGSLEIAISARGGDGKDLGTKTQTLGLNLTEDRYKAVMTDGLTITKTVDAYPAMAQIRVAVLDRVSGRVGSLVVPLPK